MFGFKKGKDGTADDDGARGTSTTRDSPMNVSRLTKALPPSPRAGDDLASKALASKNKKEAADSKV